MHRRQPCARSRPPTVLKHAPRRTIALPARHSVFAKARHVDDEPHALREEIRRADLSFQKSLWTAIDIIAIFGSVGGAVAALMGVGTAYVLALPIVLPVVSLIAALSREGLIVEVSRWRRAPHPLILSHGLMDRMRTGQQASAGQAEQQPADRLTGTAI